MTIKSYNSDWDSNESGNQKKNMRSDYRAACFTSKTDNWGTPVWIVPGLASVFKPTVDVCASSENAKALRFYTIKEDGLAQSWADEIVWCNPPYGVTIGDWMAKAFHSAMHEGATVFCLVPARTDTKWWHDYVMPPQNQIVFIRGRLKFGNAKNSAPFPSALVIMRPPGSKPYPPLLISDLLNTARDLYETEVRAARVKARASRKKVGRRKILPFVPPQDLDKAA